MPEFVVVADRAGTLRRLFIPPDVVAAGRDAVAAYADAPPAEALAEAEVFVPDGAPARAVLPALADEAEE